MRIKWGNSCNAFSIATTYGKCPINIICYNFCNEKRFIRIRIFRIDAVMAVLKDSTLSCLLKIQTMVVESSLKLLGLILNFESRSLKVRKDPT